MYYVKQKNLISLVERVTHNRFCDRNLLKTGRTFFFKKRRAPVPNKSPFLIHQLNLNGVNYNLRILCSRSSSRRSDRFSKALGLELRSMAEILALCHELLVLHEGKHDGSMPIRTNQFSSRAVGLSKASRKTSDINKIRNRAVGIESTNSSEIREFCGAARPFRSFKGTPRNPSCPKK